MGVEDNFENAPERIVAAALKIDERIFSGKTHIDAVMEMEDYFPDWDESGEKIVDGFLTNTGRFVERVEAFQIAKKAQQITSDQEEDMLDAHQIRELRPKWLDKDRS